MSDYPEYTRFQNSIDATREETEKVKNLTEYLKRTKTHIYYILPVRLRKNPVEYVYIELESRNGLTLLECKIE